MPPVSEIEAWFRAQWPLVSGCAVALAGAASAANLFFQARQARLEIAKLKREHATALAEIESRKAGIITVLSTEDVLRFGRRPDMRVSSPCREECTTSARSGSQLLFLLLIVLGGVLTLSILAFFLLRATAMTLQIAFVLVILLAWRASSRIMAERASSRIQKARAEIAQANQVR
jgi:hypothetical protein